MNERQYRNVLLCVVNGEEGVSESWGGEDIRCQRRSCGGVDLLARRVTWCQVLSHTDQSEGCRVGFDVLR